MDAPVVDRRYSILASLPSRSSLARCMSHYFTTLDWFVLFSYLVLTTWVGHRLRGQQSSIRDFFLGGRKLPWMAVAGSIIATEISGVTFIGVPGGVMAAGGNFTYLQWAIGSILARIVVGLVFVRVFYEREIYSPYDYMSHRLGKPVKTLATVFFFMGSILGQSVRVLVAALPLRVVTGMPFEWCIITIGIFALVWTLMGGMTTVIWTDVMQFMLFTFGGFLALCWIAGHLEGGFGAIWQIASEAGKTRFWNFQWGFGAELEFTFWVAILAVPFQNLSAFGVDQLNAQRMFCCKNSRDASKAIIWSSAGQLLTLLMLLVGAALYAWYHTHPPTEALADFVQWDAEKGVPGARDNVFPAWIVTQLPPGLSGLVLAAVFAASISSLDSILAALSQTTLSLWHHPERGGHTELDHARLVLQSKLLVIAWGVLLTGFTALLYLIKDDIAILPLAFGMTAYTMGPLLGMFLCALLGKGSFRGLLIGALLSFLLTMIFRNDVWGLFIKLQWLNADALAWLPTLKVENGLVRPVYSFVWMWPVTTLLTFLCGRFAGGQIGKS